MDKKYNIEKFPAFDFTFERWNAGSYYDLLGIVNGLHTVFNPVLPLRVNRVDAINAVRKYAVGYCPAEDLQVRPKIDCIAVMFFKDGIQFWSHLTCREFRNIFNESH